MQTTADLGNVQRVLREADFTARGHGGAGSEPSTVKSAESDG
ncbi:hypothetical protein QQM39_27225 [Streptomyces sp. DT2A-34]|nr:hypothetical protein [Streptomyces sp. DT2A-34]MDO0914389.1 hypothetical protein [Streptomyces sp. DT2A-34]